MARETKAEKMERMAAERAAQLAVAKATYTDRMMTVLERANKVNFELEVRDGMFALQDRDARRDGTYFLPAVWNEANADDFLRNLEFEVELKEEATREAERRAQVRAQALSKLSQEERELLGL